MSNANDQVVENGCVFEIEIDAEKLHAAELVKQFKLQMNADDAEAAATAKSKGKIKLDDDASDTGTKSIGRRKTKS